MTDTAALGLDGEPCRSRSDNCPHFMFARCPSCRMEMYALAVWDFSHGAVACKCGHTIEPSIRYSLRQEAPGVDHLMTAGSADSEPTVNVKTIAHCIQISREMAMDYGLIPDDRPPFVPTRRQRFRWWRQERLRRARMRLASRIAGFDVEDSW